jgi:hypothetical protein
MVENTPKRLLKSGGTAVGTMVCDTCTPMIAQALAAAEPEPDPCPHARPGNPDPEEEALSCD